MIAEITIVIVFCIFIFMIFLLYQRRKAKKLLKKYNPNDDLSKKGEERKGTFKGRSGREDVSRPAGLEGERLLPLESTVLDGKDSPSPRKKSRGIFRKLRK